MDKSVCIMRQWVLVSHFHSLHALSLSLSRIQLWAVQATITGSAIHWCVADVCPLQWRVWQHIHTTAPASLCDTHEGQGQDAILLSHQNFRSCWFQWVTCLFLTISILYFTSCFFILAASGTMEKNVLEDFLREARIEASVIVCRVCLHEREREREHEVSESEILVLTVSWCKRSCPLWSRPEEVSSEQ